VEVPMHLDSLIRYGSSKVLYGESNDPAFEHTYLDLEFTDKVSVFDRGPIPEAFPGLDELRCAISCKIFEVFAQDGIPTHYFKRISGTRMRTYACSVPEFSFKASGEYRLIPLEVLFRNIGNIKFAIRVLKGEMNPNRFKLKLGSTLGPGMIFNPTFIECSTKHEKSDRYVLDEEAAELAELEMWQLERLYAFARRAQESIVNLFAPTHISVNDGKFEIAYAQKRGFAACDSVSPDELGLSDISGNSYDKNPVRKWYMDTFPNWYLELLAMKKAFPDDKEAWPEYPEVPPAHLITQVCDSYEKIATVLNC
jgi:phosphoribosylaminoimidazole-succinocarboxamide synthase